MDESYSTVFDLEPCISIVLEQNVVDISSIYLIPFYIALVCEPVLSKRTQRVIDEREPSTVQNLVQVL